MYTTINVKGTKREEGLKWESGGQVGGVFFLFLVRPCAFLCSPYCWELVTSVFSAGYIANVVDIHILPSGGINSNWPGRTLLLPQSKNKLQHDSTLYELTSLIDRHVTLLTSSQPKRQSPFESLYLLVCKYFGKCVFFVFCKL